MSTALAAASSMRVLASMLDDGVSAAGLSGVFSGAAKTTVHAPDKETIDTGEESHLNLFLYSVSLNPGWRNVDLQRDSSGQRVGRPPLAIDLHFMMSAYGSDDYHAEMLLGIGMQVLHEQPFLDRGYIQNFYANLLAHSPSSLDVALSTAQLDQQVEQVKVSPHDLSADDLYKLWSAFGSKCRPSACYVATVVLIDSKVSLASALPVLNRAVGVIAYTRPQIASLAPSVFTLPPGPGTVQIVLTGDGVASPQTLAKFTDGTLVPTAMGPTPSSVAVTVPATLQPGVNTVTLVRDVTLGPPPDKVAGSSDPATFVIQPVIGTIVVAHPGSGGVTFTVPVRPACGADQPVALILDQLGAGTPQHYLVDALPEDVVGANVTFRADAIVPGTYLARIRVNGVESVPTLDPVLGFTAPTVLV